MSNALRDLWNMGDLHDKITKKMAEDHSSYYEESEAIKKKLNENLVSYKGSHKDLDWTGDPESDTYLLIENRLKEIGKDYSGLQRCFALAEILDLLAKMRNLTYDGLLQNAERHKYDWIAAAPTVSNVSGRNKDAYLDVEYGGMLTAVLREAMRIPELVKIKYTYLTVNTACYTAVADIEVVSVDDISNITGYVVKQPRGSKYKLYKTSDMAKPKLYDEVIKRVALRALYALNSADTAYIIDNFVVNIYSDAPIPATGRTTRRVILSVKASKEELDDLVIDSVSAVECVSYLKGRYNGSLSAARGVKPILLDAFDDEAQPVKKKTPSADAEKAPEVEADEPVQLFDRGEDLSTDDKADEPVQRFDWVKALGIDEPVQLFDWGEEPEDDKADDAKEAADESGSFDKLGDFNGIDAEAFEQSFVPVADILNPDNFNSLVSELVKRHFKGLSSGAYVEDVEFSDILPYWEVDRVRLCQVIFTDSLLDGSLVIVGKFRSSFSLNEVVEIYDNIRHKGYMKLVLCSETDFPDEVDTYAYGRAISLLGMSELNKLIKEYDLA